MPIEDRDLRVLKEMFQALLETQNELTDRLGATSRSVTRLAQGLSLAEENRGAEAVELEKIRKTLVELISIVSERDAVHMSGDQLAEYCSLEAVSRARNILWARKNGQPDPLPPVPNNTPVAILRETSSGHQEIIPVHTTTSSTRRRKDDSIAFKTDKEGHAMIQANIKMKTLGGWFIALIVIGVEAYMRIKDLLHHP